jgi:YqaJ-like viral recombinase domain
MKPISRQCVRAVAERTKGQWANKEYRRLRRARLGASSFGRVLALFHRCVTAIEHNSLVDAPRLKLPATDYGNAMEPEAFLEFKRMNPKWRVFKTGMWVCDHLPFLHASPDGLVCDDPRNPERFNAVLEIKCPYKLRNYSGTLSRTCYTDFLEWCGDDNRLVLKFGHEYRHQMMGQMFMTGTDHGYLVVYSPKGLYHQLRVEYDKRWERDDLSRLIAYYFIVHRGIANYKGLQHCAPIESGT